LTTAPSQMVQAKQSRALAKGACALYLYPNTLQLILEFCSYTTE